ncbi:MAG: CBS domain-containing protein, partial [Planctomycetota bacterium]
IACVVFRPAALLLRWLGRVSRAIPATRSPEDAILSRERLGELVHDVAEDGVLTKEQRRMVRNVMRVSSIPVRDAMVPVERVAAVRADFTREDLLRASAREQRSRIPVEEPGTGRFVGFVHVLDLVYSPGTPPADLVREAPEFGADVTVREALHSLRRRRQTMGFVTDGDGATRGIVTMKDLVEEVSGELPAF